MGVFRLGAWLLGLCVFFPGSSARDLSSEGARGPNLIPGWNAPAAHPSRGRALLTPASWGLQQLNLSDADTRRIMERALCFKELRESYANALNEVVPQGTHVVLLGVPKHKDYMDSVVWYGEVMGAAMAGLKLVAQCLALDDKCAAAAVEALPPGRGGAVLVHGGETFGTEKHLAWEQRLKYLTLAEGHRVVLLPQGIWFETDMQARLAADKVARTGHKDAHLFINSHFGADYARDFLNEAFASIRIASNAAVNIGHLQVPSIIQPKVDVIYFTRASCITARPELLAVLGHELTLECYDWHMVTDGTYTGQRGNHERFPPIELAMQRTNIYGNLIKRGRVVITDEVETIILSLLADVPVVGVENKFLDVAKVMELIYSISDHCSLGFGQYTTDSLGDAARIARVLLGVENAGI